jgi:hypothetical protein
VGGPPQGSGRTYRLDPQSVRGGTAAAAAGVRPFTIDLARGAVVFGSGGPQRVVPFAAYRGVAVRIEGSREAGQVRVFLDLLHGERALTVPLSVADDAEGVASDWQAWGRLLRLPLLVVSADGTISAPLATLGALTVHPMRSRRRRWSARLRPRFLVRRKTGRAAPFARVGGREIIARS